MQINPVFGLKKKKKDIKQNKSLSFPVCFHSLHFLNIIWKFKKSNQQLLSQHLQNNSLT